MNRKIHRKEKIAALQAIKKGHKTPADFAPKRVHHWYKEGHYILGTPDDAENQSEFTEEEYRAFLASKHRKHLYILHVLQPGNDPLAEE